MGAAAMQAQHFALVQIVSHGSCFPHSCRRLINLTSFFPAEIDAQEIVEARIVRPEVLNQAFAHLWLHFRRIDIMVIVLVLFLLHLEVGLRYPQKEQHLLENRCRVGIEILALENQELLSWKQAHPALELVHVYPAAQVARVPIRVAIIALILYELLPLSGYSFLFALNGLFER